jgi:glycosyltransferase involved in cell wall biosynthesis
LLLSPDAFEVFYEGILGFDRARYVSSYRSDFAWEYVRSLREYGVDLSLYIPTFGRSSLERTDDGVEVHFLRLRPAWRWIRKLSFLHRPPLLMLPPWRYFLEAVNTVCFFASLRQALLEDQIDVLFVQEHWTARLDILVRTLDIPIVAGDNGASAGIHFHVGKRGTFGRTQRIACQTKREVRRLKRYGVDAELIPNGVDTDFWTPSTEASELDREHRTLLGVGRLNDHQKRFSDLIRALALLGPNWNLKIVGTGPDERTLRQLASELEVDERVNFLGFITDKEVIRELHWEADVFALPSTSEGLPMAALQAMSCGMPTVLTPLPAFEDFIEDGRNAVLTPPCDPERLASAILQAAASRERLGAAARSSILAGYDAAATMAHLAAVLREAANRPSSIVSGRLARTGG